MDLVSHRLDSSIVSPQVFSVFFKKKRLLKRAMMMIYWIKLTTRAAAWRLMIMMMMIYWSIYMPVEKLVNPPPITRPMRCDA